MQHPLVHLLRAFYIFLNGDFLSNPSGRTTEKFDLRFGARMRSPKPEQDDMQVRARIRSPNLQLRSSALSSVEGARTRIKLSLRFMKSLMLPSGFEPESGAREAPMIDRTTLREHCGVAWGRCRHEWFIGLWYALSANARPLLIDFASGTGRFPAPNQPSSNTPEPFSGGDGPVA